MAKKLSEDLCTVCGDLIKYENIVYMIGGYNYCSLDCYKSENDYDEKHHTLDVTRNNPR